MTSDPRVHQHDCLLPQLVFFFFLSEILREEAISKTWYNAPKKSKLNGAYVRGAGLFGTESEKLGPPRRLEYTLGVASLLFSSSVVDKSAFSDFCEKLQKSFIYHPLR